MNTIFAALVAGWPEWRASVADEQHPPKGNADARCSKRRQRFSHFRYTPFRHRFSARVITIFGWYFPYVARTIKAGAPNGGGGDVTPREYALGGNDCAHDQPKAPPWPIDRKPNGRGAAGSPRTPPRAPPAWYMTIPTSRSGNHPNTPPHRRQKSNRSGGGR